MTASTELAVAAVTEAIQRAFPLARGLILTGSTARGEETIVRTATGERWLSDIELLVVIGDSDNLRRAAGALASLAAEIERRLAGSGIQVCVELTPAPQKYFSSIRPHLFGYELRRNGRQLLGQEDYLARIPPFEAAEIPREDAWRLLSNRMVEWLNVLRQGQTAAPEIRFYSLTKQYLDLATSLGLFSGHYRPTYRSRAEAADVLARSLPEPARPRFIEAVGIAAGFKLEPQQKAYDFLWRGAALESAGWGWLAADLPATMLAAWRWELAEIAGRPVENAAEALRALCACQGWKERLRGWGRPLVRRHLRSGGTFLSRMAYLWTRGTPRGLVYACAAELLASHASGDRAGLPWVKKHLPALFGATGDAWEDLAGQCVQNWERFLRMGGA